MFKACTGRRYPQHKNSRVETRHHKDLHLPMIFYLTPPHISRIHIITLFHQQSRSFLLYSLCRIYARDCDPCTSAQARVEEGYSMDGRKIDLHDISIPVQGSLQVKCVRDENNLVTLTKLDISLHGNPLPCKSAIWW